MASNTGIEYFPFNVDFFDDDKVALIESEFGIKGTAIAIRLLCKIYREGYYYKWGDDECQIFAKKAGADIVPNTVNEVVKGLVRRSFFDKGVFDSFKVLTSRGIQQRYFEATRRRQRVEVIKEYLLIDSSKFANLVITNMNGSHVTSTTTEAPITPVVSPVFSHPNLRPVPQSYESIDQEVEQLKQNEIWMENVCMRFHLPLAQVEKYISDFAIDCRSRGTLRHDSIQDAQRHFNDWLRIQIKVNEQQAKDNNNGNRSKNEKRRASTAVNAKVEDFKTTF